MKILLIQPNYRGIYSYAGNKDVTPIFPPMGLAYIAAVLRKNNLEVRILEANALNLSYGDIRKGIIEYKPDIIGVTSTTCLIYEAYKIAKISKECSKARFIAGGIHPSTLPRKTLEECKDIDIVVIGEGEFPILDIAKGKPLNRVKGIAYRKNRSIVINKAGDNIHKLDELPFPARDLLPMDKYFAAGARRQPADYILSSRGCPYSCIFCADHLVHGKKFRFRSAENVVAEIEMLAKKYKIKEFDFIDDNFTLLPERVVKICDMMIEKGLNKRVIWRCSNGVRIDRLSPELLKKMKDAGCYMVSLGIESGNEQILRNMKKGITLQQVRRTVKWCKEAGIETRGLFMFGNLGENEKTMNDTIRFAKELDLDTATFHITVPFPKTEYWEIINKEGKMFARNWQDYISYNKVTFQIGELKPKMLLKMQKKAYYEFYLRPRMIIKKILEVKSPRQLVTYARAGLGVLKFTK